MPVVAEIQDFMSRQSHVKSIFGPEFTDKIKNTRILIVGSGGIGCELCGQFFSYFPPYLWSSDNPAQ